MVLALIMMVIFVERWAHRPWARIMQAFMLKNLLRCIAEVCSTFLIILFNILCCRDCTGFVYERADCSGFGGPTNTGICIQIRDSVVSWPSQGAEMGSLNPFAQ